MSHDFERAKAFLKKSNSTGETLYDHLTQVLLKIAKDKPDNALEQFEAISVAVKKAKLQPSQLKELQTSPLKPAEERRVLAFIEQCLAVVQSVPEVSSADLKAVAALTAQLKAMDPEEQEEEIKKLKAEKTPAFLKGADIPDMVQDQRVLAWAGVGIQQEEMYTLLLSIQNLSRQQGNFASARFFGKIMGTQKDYYIVEAKLDQYAKQAVDPDTKKEPAGTGANAYVYFVANSPQDAWVMLPDVLPEQIITARLMRRYFSGVLTNPVLGYPRFPWPEASYLRAQISRIASATVVSPKGVFEMAEAEEEDAPEQMVLAGEPELPDAEGLKEAENWCHHMGHLLKQGRCAAWAPPEGEEEEEEEPPAEEEEEAEPEEPLPMLSGLEGDALPVVGEEEEEEENKPKLWRFSVYPANTLHRVNAAYSLNWPGAVAAANGAHFANVYIGWGQKYLQTLYTPPPPPVVSTEYVSPFNPEEAEEGDVDPMIEQLEPQPPKEGGDDEGDEGDGGEGDDDEG